MTFSNTQRQELIAPLNKAHVATRQQAGQTLSYLAAWHVIAEANRIFGFAEWDRETVEMRQLGEPRLVDGKSRVGYSSARGAGLGLVSTGTLTKPTKAPSKRLRAMQ